MKKLLIITSFFSFLAFTTSAQKSANKPPVEFGVKAGLNLATLMGGEGPEYDYGYKARPGMYVGGLAHIHLTHQVAIQPELFLSGQGGYYYRDNYKNSVILNYLNSPLLVQYMFNNGFRLQTGPQVGVLLSAVERVKNNADNPHSRVTSNYNQFDFSWVFGGGYIWPSGFGVDARVNAGISEVNGLDNNRDHLSNLVFATGVFYQFKHTNSHHK